jgi:hypothetical protein
LVHGLLAAIGDDNLRGRNLGARVNASLVCDCLAKIWQANRRCVAVILRVANGNGRCLNDVGRRCEVWLTSSVGDYWTACSDFAFASTLRVADSAIEPIRFEILGKSVTRQVYRTGIWALH